MHMRSGGFQGKMARALDPSLLLCAAATISGCASGYAGIALAPGAASPEIQSLARRAQAGDKHAQLELGIAFEEGRGVLRDLDKAEKFYRAAATDSGGTLWVYSPPVGNGAAGRVIPVDRGPVREALLEAKRRLGALQAREDNLGIDDRGR